MHKLTLKFDTIQEPIEIDLEPTVNAIFFAKRLIAFARPADRIFYNKPVDQLLSEFFEKVLRAKQIFNLNWNLEDLNQQSFNSWHRDIETFDLSKYPPWSQEKGDFFIDLHHLMHKVEQIFAGAYKNSERKHIQVKWFNSSVPWPCTPQMISENDLVAGDVYADYPHVGKDPWTCMIENDNQVLKQSCRLRDACPPGFFIVVGQPGKIDCETRKQQLTSWYHQHRDQLSDLFDLETMLAHDGYFKIGTISNKNQLSLLQTIYLNSVTIV